MTPERVTCPDCQGSGVGWVYALPDVEQEDWERDRCAKCDGFGSVSKPLPSMDFRVYDHPNCGPCLHVLDDSGRVVLEMPQLCKESFKPDPPLGYEVWTFAGDDDQLGTVTYHATEETGDGSRPWCFESYADRYRNRRPPQDGTKTWHATLPAALAGSWARGLELLHESETEQALERR